MLLQFKLSQCGWALGDTSPAWCKSGWRIVPRKISYNMIRVEYFVAGYLTTIELPVVSREGKADSTVQFPCLKFSTRFQHFIIILCFRRSQVICRCPSQLDSHPPSPTVGLLKIEHQALLYYSASCHLLYSRHHPFTLLKRPFASLPCKCIVMARAVM
jgi:hypothetical protein